MLNKLNKLNNFNNARRNFNRALHDYDAKAQVQHQVGTTLINAIQSIPIYPTHVIDLGCGTGFTTEVLAKRITYQRFAAIDFADKLISIAKQRLAPYHIEVCIQDFDHFQASYDLIFSNMALHWSQDLPRLFRHCYQNLTSPGYFAFSIPLQNSFKNLQGCHKQPFSSLAAIKNNLIINNFNIILCKQASLLLEFPSVLMAMKAIKAIGANTTIAPKKSLYGKTYLQNILQQSPQTAQGTFILNYEIGYFIAQKK